MGSKIRAHIETIFLRTSFLIPARDLGDGHDSQESRTPMPSAKCSIFIIRAIERAVRLLRVLKSIMHISKISFSNPTIATIERRS
jgi:hypothetical protein